MPLTITNCIVTAYCACSICCGTKHAKDGITASGNIPQQGVTIAASRKIPLGSYVKINGQTFIVQDRLSRKYDGRFDIYFRRHEDARKFGKQTMNVEIISTPNRR